MSETLPRGGEGCWDVRTGSSIVMETPVFCWLMERRMRVSLGVTRIKTVGKSLYSAYYVMAPVISFLFSN